MKEYLIDIVIKLDNKPTTEELDNIFISFANELDNISTCWHLIGITPPSESLIISGYVYKFHLTFKCKEVLKSSDIFNRLNPIHPLVLINLKESRFSKDLSKDIYWYHEGETTYHDGGTYISPNYDLYINGNTDYTIQYVPLTIKNMSDRDKKYYKDVTYMWVCTGCWDNFMKATTLDEALKEFEDYYYNILWNSIENTRKRLSEAEDKYKQFVEYRWRTK